MNRPLIISDCDEVLLHMIVPFRDWLGQAHDIAFALDREDFSSALTRKADGSLVEGAEIWRLLNGFFETEMHRQAPFAGAVDTLLALSAIADIVVLTNILDYHGEPRRAQLQAIGLDVPVYCNQGGKGAALARIIDEYQPPVAVFVDDLGHQLESAAKHMPDVWRLHMVGEPLIASTRPAEPTAHARIDNWPDASEWIRDRLLAGSPAPLIEREMK